MLAATGKTPRLDSDMQADALRMPAGHTDGWKCLLHYLSHVRKIAFRALRHSNSAEYLRSGALQWQSVFWDCMLRLGDQLRSLVREVIVELGSWELDGSVYFDGRDLVDGLARLTQYLSLIHI